jgi:RsbT co-antagonist protein rsbRD N-terminal domain
MINELLNKKKSAIVSNWVESILNSYPAESTNFLKLKKNRFSNPIGHVITTNADKIFDELINDRDFEKIKLLLDEIIKLRAVQNFSPSQAIYFLFHLKNVIRDEIKAELSEKTISDELIKFESVIDKMTLLGFDLYMESREKIFKIRVNEIKSRSFKAVETTDGF